nr:type II toxin-antitoxin system HicA family toxin [Escherichia coli]
MSIKNDGHYFCRAGGNRPDGLNEPVTDKLLAKFLNSKKTFEWDELVVLFSSLGYVKKDMQGSRVRFFNAEINHTILMHRPHPESYIKGGTLKTIKQNLKEAGVL